jgi:YVTN family beta-propeller protein
VVDAETYRVVNFFSTPLNDVPTFMILDSAGRSAYLLDERSGYVSRMDLSSGRIIARVAVGYRPVYALYLPQQNLLAVSLHLSQTVVLLDPATLQMRGSLPSGSGPQGLAVSDNLLYVAEQGDNSVAIFDLGSRARHERISVGYGPQRILVTQNQIYVAQEADASIAVLAPGQLGVLREITGMGLPQEMVYRPLLRKLYVADHSGGGIAVIDVNTNRQVGYIELGARPQGLVTRP